MPIYTGPIYQVFYDLFSLLIMPRKWLHSFLRLQHLRNDIALSTGDTGFEPPFINMFLTFTLFFGAKLFGLIKPNSNHDGCALQQLYRKICPWFLTVCPLNVPLLSLGWVQRNVAKAFLNLPPESPDVILKLDLRNAFNSISWKVINVLETAKTMVVGLGCRGLSVNSSK